MDDRQIERDRDDGDYVARSTRRVEGWDCRAVALSDTGVIRWRFRRGVAPPRDSLAAVHDSLAAAKSPALSPRPPTFLERLTADGRVAARYDVQSWGLQVTRESGAPVATLHGAATPGRVTLDLAPDVSDEEARVLRLLAVAVDLLIGPT